jgi:hypothetical protein
MNSTPAKPFAPSEPALERQAVFLCDRKLIGQQNGDRCATIFGCGAPMYRASWTTSLNKGKSMAPQAYDLVGDIHGHADALHRLLGRLDYIETNGVFRHRERKMIFVGDFIDRGPEQLEVLRIGCSMCEAGAAAAVMGNHEFNAIGWATKRKDGSFLRNHSKKNANQHAEFLGQIGEDSADHSDALRWFRNLPLWLDLPEIRVVHACWHEPSRQALSPFLDAAGRLTDEGLVESFRQGSAAHAAVEVLLKGPGERLPDGVHFLDNDGHKRDEVRLRWWDSNATTFRKAALEMEGRDREIPDTRLPKDYRYQETKPVFFGHYWLKGQPHITASNAACLDFSVAKKGYLTAYQWSGETGLVDSSLLFVTA